MYYQTCPIPKIRKRTRIKTGWAKYQLKNIPNKLRLYTWERDDGLCQMCHRSADSPHHVISAGHGRRKIQHQANIFWSCNECHSLTHDGPESEKLQQQWEEISRKRYGETIDEIKKYMWGW